MTDTKILFRLLILTFLSLCLWVFSGAVGKDGQADRKVSVAITGQLEPQDYVRPAELRCDAARVTTSNELTFDCWLKNNTARGITAANVINTIMLEQEGRLTKDEYSSTIVTIVSATSERMGRPIAPGEEYHLGQSGPLSYTDAVVKGVEVRIDYVEFDDGTALGPDRDGSKTINETRGGAAKFRGWVSLKYKQNRKSLEQIVPLLQKDLPFPNELEFKSAHQEIGAKTYRRFLRKLYETRGPAEVEKHIN